MTPLLLLKGMAATVIAAITLAGGSTITATLTGPSHTPKVAQHWAYTVHATKDGKPASGQITAQIVDPLGTAHAVLVGTTKKKVTNLPFTGTFQNFVVWPAAATGVPLNLRVTLHLGTTTKVLTYLVTPKA